MTSISDQLRQFIAEETGMSDDEFQNDTQLFSEGYIDSFTMTAVVAFIEETYEVDIPQSEITLENFDTIDNMTAFITRAKG
ncbi:Acyl carrier protein [Aliiroseovarius pelagivivens]|uniref:Acyl carrier protein n=1 Tax=Aliiroseovarius pelagivivens TaxID=1639690 RepID=A0A2R8ATD2_9RHOB|nr:acyl carrier protein [Aliiroseovarius pelagivivens]SPF79109.1 Acyl carrier protein [Aliiroseovarius pelagivivens]